MSTQLVILYFIKNIYNTYFKVFLPIPEQGLVYDYRFDHGGTLSLTREEDENEDEVIKEKKVEYFLLV